LKEDIQNLISNVFCAPGLHHNLLSMEQLSDKCYNMDIHHGYYKVKNDSKLPIIPLKIQHENTLIEVLSYQMMIGCGICILDTSIFLG